jgi:glycosyltransferase involved in cell wall biosynthesis
MSLPPILFLTPDPPGAIWQDKPQIARRLARVTTVLYVGEEPYLRTWPGLAGATQPALTHIADGLYTFRWSPLAPVTGAPLLGPLTAALRRRRLQSALRAITSPPLTINHSPIPQLTISPSPLLWLFRPGQQHWIDQLHPRLVIYHVVDEYSAYPGLSPAQVERQRSLDRQLTARADLVFCTAQSLVDARRPLNPNTHYMPNAVDFEAFQRAIASATGFDTAQRGFDTPQTATQPTATQPTATQPTPTQPTATQPTATQPTATQPTATQPTATQPTATRPTAIQPTATRPTATQPTATQSTNLPIYQSPLLAVVGGINAKVDLRLLTEVAARRPDWRIDLVGPLGYGLDADELARLRALPNVRLAGAVPPEQAPAVMAGCDVGLIPYKLNEQTRHVNPLKVYEYLAAGRPVVGTPLPELRQFEPLVRLAGDVDGFVAAVEAALAEGDAPDAVAARLAVAAANTWDVRVERMVGLIEGGMGSGE